jgi:ribosome-associated protein
VPGEPITVRPGVVVPERELSWRFSRSSGPGGQSVNTADSRVELSVDVANTTALTPGLRQRALDRLSDRLVDGVLTVAIAPPPRRRRATKPTRASVERRLDSKRRRGDVKQSRRPPDS